MFEKRFVESPYLIWKSKNFNKTSYRFSTASNTEVSVILLYFLEDLVQDESGVFTAKINTDKYEVAAIQPGKPIEDVISGLTTDEVLQIIDYANGKGIDDSELVALWEKTKGE